MKISGSQNSRWNLLVLVFFVLTGLLIYWNSLNSPFQYDDDKVVVKNFNIHDLKDIPRFFVNPRFGQSNPNDDGHYRPLVMTSYAINYAIGRLNPVGYHVVNLAFHVGTAFVLFLVVKMMLGSMGHGSEDTRRDKTVPPIDRRGFLTPPLVAAVASGLIFLVHPFNSEAVNYTTARSSVMSGFFYLLSFYCWVRYRKNPPVSPFNKGGLRGIYYIASLLAFIAGMLSKEVLVTLPIALWLYDLYFGGRRLLLWRTYRPYFPFVLLMVVPYLFMRIFSFGKVVGDFQRDIITQLLTEVPVLVKHWEMFIFPSGLSLFHDVEIFHGMTGALFLSIILLFLYISLAIYLLLLKQTLWRIISFFMFWFFTVLLPTIVIPLNAIFQENRGYLAIVSFSILAGVLIRELGNRLPRLLIIIILVILTGVYGIATVQRNKVWQDDIMLWKDATEKAPRSVRAYAGLAASYRDRGDLFLSIETAKNGIAVNPDDHEIHLNLGRNYHLVGDLDQAINEYELALQANPKQAIVWNELATLYSKKGDIERAERYLREAVKRWDTLAPLHYNLGVVLIGRGKFHEAAGEFLWAIAEYPQYFRARYELAELYEKLGRFREADEQYREILQYNSTALDSNSLLFGQDRGMVNAIIEKARQRLNSRNGFKGQR